MKVSHITSMLTAANVLAKQVLTWGVPFMDDVVNVQFQYRYTQAIIESSNNIVG